MTKEQLAPWIEKLTQANPKDRTAIVGEMCKENGLKVGDAWRLLKEAGFNSKAAQQGNDHQGGAAPDNTGADSGNQQTGSAPPEKPAKRRVRHEHLKGKNLIVGNRTIEFDADGIAEMDAADAERLLTIPGYMEVSDA